MPDGGAILVRPDGFIGFRAAPVDETTMDALDDHLATYLVPRGGASAAPARLFLRRKSGPKRRPIFHTSRSEV